MNKKQVVEILANIGVNLKPSQVDTIETIGVRTNVNSAGASLSDYHVKTKKGYFAITEELVPNVYGSTAFSTEKRFIVVGSNLKDYDIIDEEEEEVDEEVATEDYESEDL